MVTIHLNFQKLEAYVQGSEKLPFWFPFVSETRFTGEFHFIQDGKSSLGEETVLELKESKQSFTFVDVSEKPYLSALRGFSAPVKLKVEGETDDDLIFLLANDTDSFNKWEASQRLQKTLLKKFYTAALDAKQVSLLKLEPKKYNLLKKKESFSVS